MHSAIEELKTRAEILHHRVQTGDVRARQRVITAQQRRRVAADQAGEPQLRDCLNTIAAEWGFPSWPEAKLVLNGESNAPAHFGDLLCPVHVANYLNHWERDYEQAARLRAERGGYLLAYRTHYFIVQAPFIAALGLDPEDPDWTAIGFDWPRPLNVEARTRLYSKLVAGLRKESESS